MNQIDQACEGIIATCALRAQGGHTHLGCLSKACKRIAVDDDVFCDRHIETGGVKTHVLERLMEHKAHRDALKALGVVLPKRGTVFDTAKEASASSSSSSSESSSSESDSEGDSEGDSSDDSSEEKVRCSAKAKSTGKQCNNKTTRKSGLCHVHGPKKEKKEKKSSSAKRCSENTKKGDRCNNMTTSKSGKCFKHK